MNRRKLLREMPWLRESTRADHVRPVEDALVVDTLRAEAHRDVAFARARAVVTRSITDAEQRRHALAGLDIRDDPWQRKTFVRRSDLARYYEPETIEVMLAGLTGGGPMPPS
jgi:hypothetical protein